MVDPIDIAKMRAAFDAREFFVVYQPIVSLGTGRCLGAESLIRWRRDKDVLEAHEFMPLTDRTPLSGTITYFVIDTVASELGDWLGDHPDAHIGINIPPEILGRGGIQYAAEKSGLAAHAKQLILEITERGVPDQLGLDALNSVSSTGARVALDDTTLSAANLALLLRCPFDLVKIDHSLVSQIEQGRPQPAWLDGLAALLGATRLQIVAEGVETPYQAQTLQARGIQMAQGHLFSAPLLAEDLKRYYAASEQPRPE